MKGMILKIFLICLIIILSILDAPEYIQCIHIGQCEFFELNAHLSNDLKSNIMENHYSYEARNNFFSIFNNLINNNELIKNFISFYIAAILTFLNFSFLHIKRKTPYLVNIAVPSFLIENSMPSQTLKLLEISVIRS